jgi:hypothetical protein
VARIPETIPERMAIRQKLFYTGVALVVVEFLGQVFGSWPYHLTYLGLWSC